MKDIIVSRCCGNCEYSISPENEKDIMLENDYEEDDPTRPRAGDCCLGMDHGFEFVCMHHEYLSGGLETYVFYDDNYVEPSYYVVDTYYDNVLKYFKLYRKGEYGNYIYGIRVIDLFPIKSDFNNGVSFEIRKIDNRELYGIITMFAKSIEKNVVWDIDKKSFMSTNVYEYNTGLYFTGSIDDSVIDIRIDNSIDEVNYNLISQLFINMSVLTSNEGNEKIYNKVRMLNR